MWATKLFVLSVVLACLWHASNGAAMPGAMYADLPQGGYYKREAGGRVARDVVPKAHHIEKRASRTDTIRAINCGFKQPFISHDAYIACLGDD